MVALYNGTQVSVPLRGLDMRKLGKRNDPNGYWEVSVPLRGLDMRKPRTQQ